ncbi:uncharacterized protein MKK02DRAFT_25289 [Dioszegia hungarica]|uniref:NAD(P)-binding domain-containing protein n=1 Tax=Dioszegia hungarica TaxID=4972 RepID=A0AA38LU87_9TREE|nr:uncharacterized protein MKK02DRAFT_25289 [Dioszegia hungarica]KAI9635353.1 hypothetical protein MKK02DRAFT_25289 [Dioszegia hungarica]
MKFLVVGGGGQVARHLARLALKEGHEVVPVVRNEDHVVDLKSLGASPTVLDLESAPVTDLTTLLTDKSPDVVVFAAGAGGKGDPSRTRKVDFDGAVKVYDAMEAANCKRLIVVGAMDVRNRSKDMPEWYTKEDKEMSDKMWGAIPKYMEAKYDAEVELHRRKQIAFTVIRPGGLTTEPAGGVTMGKTALGKTR